MQQNGCRLFLINSSCLQKSKDRFVICFNGLCNWLVQMRSIYVMSLLAATPGHIMPAPCLVENKSWHCIICYCGKTQVPTTTKYANLYCDHKLIKRRNGPLQNWVPYFWNNASFFVWAARALRTINNSTVNWAFCESFNSVEWRHCICWKKTMSSNVIL